MKVRNGSKSKMSWIKLRDCDNCTGKIAAPLNKGKLARQLMTTPE